jgi:hypothetical protein
MFKSCNLCFFVFVVSMLCANVCECLSFWQVDDVFYILKKCAERAFSTCNVSAGCAVRVLSVIFSINFIFLVLL